jgi:hypothetical protein
MIVSDCSISYICASGSLGSTYFYRVNTAKPNRADISVEWLAFEAGKYLVGWFARPNVSLQACNTAINQPNGSGSI